MIAKHLGDPSGHVVSGYWPIKAEPDLRFWMESLAARGARMALPVVEIPSAPLAFRAWHPGTRMERGHWNIPVPPPDAPRLVPEVALAPLVGWDGAGYRLGYGGGYFDRTPRGPLAQALRHRGRIAFSPDRDDLFPTSRHKVGRHCHGGGARAMCGHCAASAITSSILLWMGTTIQGNQLVRKRRVRSVCSKTQRFA